MKPKYSEIQICNKHVPLDISGNPKVIFFPSAGITPQSGWAVDPFGHSATMPYLLKRANLTSMLIQRVHYSIKKHFASTRSLEFMWRQAWGEWTGASNVISFRYLPLLGLCHDESCPWIWPLKTDEIWKDILRVCVFYCSFRGTILI